MGNEKDEYGIYIGTNDTRCLTDIKNDVYPCDRDEEYGGNTEKEDEG